MALVPSPDQLRDVEAALAAGDTRRASMLAQSLLGKGYEHPDLLMLAAHHHIATGAPEQALAHARRASALAPTSVEAHQVLGLSLVQLARYPEAVAAFDDAIKLAPEVAALHLNRAMALDDMGELAHAREAYARAVELRPGFTPAHARLAYIAARQGDTKTARSHAERALAADARETVASFALASAELDEGHFDAAERILAPLTVTYPAMATSMMGDALHGRARYAEAFQAYEAAGRAADQQYARHFRKPGVESALDWVKGRVAYFTGAPAGFTPREGDGADTPPANTHAFLVGFPRSGTTLLESVLGAHPDIAVMDERDWLYRAAAPLGKGREALDRFAALDESGLDPVRAAYWDGMRNEGLTGDHLVLVDKMPLNLVQLCFVRRLFPGAKILFALRDPRDVVLSCFRRRFGMTSQMYELNTLEGAARYYDAVMTLAALYRDQLGLEICDVRHEDVVADFADETRRVCDFLGVEWTPGMNDFADGARARASNTPSAAQLARGLASEAKSEWRNYRGQMAPVLPLLAPWVARFGYPES